jgi:hypothetical protein
MNEWDKLRNKAKMYKEIYPKGTRIEVISMENDPRPIASGTKGTVDFVDSIGTIHCTFDNGRVLGLIPGEDQFRKI